MISRPLLLIQYFYIVCALVLGAATAAGWVLHSSRAALAAQDQKFRLLRSTLAELKESPALRAEEPFTASFPNAGRTDELVRFTSTQAQALDVRIMSMAVQPTSSTARELGRVQFNISLRGSYKATKTLLNDLQERYVSLGVQTLSMRATPQDAALRETQLTLVWYVKD